MLDRRICVQHSADRFRRLDRRQNREVAVHWDPARVAGDRSEQEKVESRESGSHLGTEEGSERVSGGRVWTDGRQQPVHTLASDSCIA